MRDRNRQRRLLEYRPTEAAREERAMQYHEQVQRGWAQQAQRLAELTGRDPSTLSMFSDDAFVRANEERVLISEVAFSIGANDMGSWSPLPRIGDLYAQRDNKNRLKNVEFTRSAVAKEGVSGSRPTSFFESRYYKKQSKKLRSYLEKAKPHDPSPLIVIGEPWPTLTSVDVPDEVAVATVQDENEVVEGIQESVARVRLDVNRLVFTSVPGVTRAQSVVATNDGTTAIYYAWEVAKDVELMFGAGSGRTPVHRDGLDAFDWRESEQFGMPTNVKPPTRSEFAFTQLQGSILPGCSKTFDFMFKSDVPGCFLQRWIMRTTPAVTGAGSLSVSLRGSCEVERPTLTAFKASIDDSLHESERTRCVEEILAAVMERVGSVCGLRNRPGDELIDGDVLMDDRAPAFEEKNKKWGLDYSPGLFAALTGVANKCWDALGVTGFDRYWDMSVEALTKMAMKVEDGAMKREILGEVNAIIERKMTASAAGNLTFSLALIQFATLFEDLPARFKQDSVVLGKDLPMFLVPKPQDHSDMDDVESSRKKGRGKRKPPPPKKARGKGKAEDEAALAALATEAQGELAPELKEAMKLTVIEALKERIVAFEKLAGESTAVAQQFTRVNEIERLDTDLNAEVDDDL